MFNPNRVKASLDVSLARARASVRPAPAPRCPDHPGNEARRIHLTHPDAILNYRVAFRMACDVDIDALKYAGYRVEVL